MGHLISISGLALGDVFIENFGKKGFSPKKPFRLRFSLLSNWDCPWNYQWLSKNYPKINQGFTYSSFSVYLNLIFERVQLMQIFHASKKGLKIWCLNTWSVFLDVTESLLIENNSMRYDDDSLRNQKFCISCVCARSQIFEAYSIKKFLLIW